MYLSVTVVVIPTAPRTQDLFTMKLFHHIDMNTAINNLLTI